MKQSVWNQQKITNVEILQVYGMLKIFQYLGRKGDQFDRADKKGPGQH